MKCWGPQKDGLIDFALTSTTVIDRDCIDIVNERLKQQPNKDGGLGFKFHVPIPGSRKRADGVAVKWTVTRPVFQEGRTVPTQDFFSGGRLDAPFFCHDVTKRASRVASEDKTNTTHHCGAKGIASCDILVPQNCLNEYLTLYEKILGSRPQANEDGAGGKSSRLTSEYPMGLEEQRLSFVQEEAEKMLHV
jgi:hypothetical protein